MLPRLLIIGIAFIISSSFITEQEKGLIVHVSQLRNNKGHVLLSIFNSRQGFPSDPGKAFGKLKMAITNKKASFLIPSLPSGTYAIAILHDENDDLKMNTNWIGLPLEGYGFSNNVMGSFGPPSYSRASILYKSGQLQSININTRY